MSGGRTSRGLPIRYALSTALTTPVWGIAAAANGLLDSQSKLGAQVQDLPFPGVGRMIGGFLVTVALGVVAVWVLRRFWPGVLSRRGAASNIRLLERTAISATLVLSTVEVDGSRFLVAESRSGVGLTRVGDAPQPATERGA